MTRPRSALRRPATREVTARISGDRRTAEALQLEMQRLARQLGLTVGRVSIRRVNPPAR